MRPRRVLALQPGAYRVVDRVRLGARRGERVMGKCCKCREHRWTDEPALPIVYIDQIGKEFCLFHADKDHKGVSQFEFNKAVLRRIRNAIQNAGGPHTPSECNMSGIVCPWEISFSGPEFRRCPVKLNFSSSMFFGDTTFSAMTFYSPSSFASATFKSKSTFSYVTFLEQTTFYNSQFIGECDFNDVKFHSSANFTFASFKKEVSLFRVIFNGDTDFRHAKFSREVDFFQTELNRKTNLFRCKGKDLSFHLQELSAHSLSNIVFTRLEIRQFTFRDCRWPKNLGLETHMKSVGANFQDCEELYRAMKQRACLEHDQGMASKWHYREKYMKLKRRLWLPLYSALFDFIDYKQSFAAIFKKLAHDIFVVFCTPLRASLSLLFIYWFTSGFGERAVRAFAWLTGYVLATMALCAQVDLSDGTTAILPLELPERVFAALQHLLFITNPKYSPNSPNWRAALLILTRVLVPVQFTLFALAVRNRFRR